MVFKVRNKKAFANFGVSFIIFTTQHFHWAEDMFCIESFELSNNFHFIRLDPELLTNTLQLYSH